MNFLNTPLVHLDAIVAVVTNPVAFPVLLKHFPYAAKTTRLVCRIELWTGGFVSAAN